MTTQPEALRIAEFFESFRGSSHAIDGELLHVAAAAEFRRLHQECEALREALLAAPGATHTDEAGQGRRVDVPDGLSVSDAEFWLSRRAQIIEACRSAGYNIVTTAHGCRLLKLGKVEAQATPPSAAQAEGASAVAALTELVALKDIKERADKCWPGDPEGPELLREYSTRKDVAWAAARRALTAAPAQAGAADEDWPNGVMHGWAALTAAPEKLAPAPQQAAQWCDQCGEGTTRGLCRAKPADPACKFATPPPPQQAAQGGEDWWLALAVRHKDADWNSYAPDGYLNAVKVLVTDARAAQGERVGLTAGTELNVLMNAVRRLGPDKTNAEILASLGIGTTEGAAPGGEGA